ncbi:ATP-dependent acyl-CoA ligase [Amycolatopsis sp. NPDC051903]|uniref:ATP-dependent acyl-CoA ligase n=1 Tax=Amycolatopsis sp. NPDC051903 TaxID=3363936 RepID=UPI0037B41E86
MRYYEIDQRTTAHILADKAARVGDRPFLHWAGRTYTYRDLDEITNRYANGFADLGITRGDHVAMMMPNGPEFLWTLWGLGKLGAVAVPLNTAAKGELLRYFLDQSDATAICVAGELLPRVAAVLSQVPAVRTVLGLGADPALLAALDGIATHDLATLHEAPPTPPRLAEPVRWNDPHLILYTSGTTGPSKGAICPQAQGHAVGHQMASLNGYRQDDVLYTCLPVFHGNALWYTVYAALWAEASVALYPHFSASRFWSQIRESRATVFNALGAMANIIWQQPPSEQDRDHSVRICMMVPNSRELAEGFLERYGTRVTSVYAMTENCAVTAFTPDDPLEKVPSAGRVRPDMSVRIFDDDGVPLPTGEVGEICLRPNEPGTTMLEYYKMPEATVGATRDLWFHTGDRGSLDEDGYLFFSDRKKEAIRRRGENISAYEVETIVCRHPAILEAAAVPVASELGEDDLMVYLVTEDGASASYEEIIAFCDEHMPYFMVPRYLEFIDRLPKTPSEKIEKYKLKTAAAKRVGELWDREAAGIVIKK